MNWWCSCLQPKEQEKGIKFTSLIFKPDIADNSSEFYRGNSKYSEEYSFKCEGSAERIKVEVKESKKEGQETRSKPYKWVLSSTIDYDSKSTNQFKYEKCQVEGGNVN